MSIRYLIDENLDPLYKVQLLRKGLNTVVYAVGDPGVPPKGTLDPDILLGVKKTIFCLLQTIENQCQCIW